MLVLALIAIWFMLGLLLNLFSLVAEKNKKLAIVEFSKWIGPDRVIELLLNSFFYGPFPWIMPSGRRLLRKRWSEFMTKTKSAEDK